MGKPDRSHHAKTSSGLFRFASTGRENTRWSRQDGLDVRYKRIKDTEKDLQVQQDRENYTLFNLANKGDHDIGMFVSSTTQPNAKYYYVMEEKHSTATNRNKRKKRRPSKDTGSCDSGSLSKILQTELKGSEPRTKRENNGGPKNPAKPVNSKTLGVLRMADAMFCNDEEVGRDFYIDGDRYCFYSSTEEEEEDGELSSLASASELEQLGGRNENLYEIMCHENREQKSDKGPTFLIGMISACTMACDSEDGQTVADHVVKPRSRNVASSRSNPKD